MKMIKQEPKEEEEEKGEQEEERVQLPLKDQA